jgi:hypothetical protein
MNNEEYPSLDDTPSEINSFLFTPTRSGFNFRKNYEISTNSPKKNFPVYYFYDNNNKDNWKSAQLLYAEVTGRFKIKINEDNTIINNVNRDKIMTSEELKEAYGSGTDYHRDPDNHDDDDDDDWKLVKDIHNDIKQNKFRREGGKRKITRKQRKTKGKRKRTQKSRVLFKTSKKRKSMKGKKGK